MSVYYFPVPTSEPSAAAELQALGADEVVRNSPSRLPTPHELRQVLERLEGYSTEYHIGERFWQADVSWTANPEEGPYTLVEIESFNGNEDCQHEFFFNRGWQNLVIQIMERLSVICGPFVLICDSAPVSVLITTGIDPEKASEEWDRRSQQVDGSSADDEPTQQSHDWAAM